MSDRPMAHPQKGDTKQLARQRRRARLATELRSNLLKRKEQARGRTLQGAPGPENGNEQADAQEVANAHKRGPTEEVA